MNGADWQPTATLQALRLRAQKLAQARTFFATRNVLEVETPALARYAATDPQIESLAVRDPQDRHNGYLQPSPEYAMKRLLAAGSGDIYQICRVYRAAERSRLHNPEFTLIEWYRTGFGLQQMMQETAQLAALLLDGPDSPRAFEYTSYSEVFARYLSLDPLQASLAQLQSAAAHQGLQTSSIADCSRDDLLDLLMATAIGPQLGRKALTCVHHYPASQAALAQLDVADARTALRFELYAEGIELANGYVELGDAALQQQRFIADSLERQRRGLTAHTGDPRLLSALQAGLPACAGVALGLDRVLMLALDAQHIDAVLAFAQERA
jgi:lysyl-tRNA synthetase class 2